MYGSPADTDTFTVGRRDSEFRPLRSGIEYPRCWRVARWARRNTADKNTSVSRLVGSMLERETRMNDDYWRAYECWKQLAPIPGIDTGAKPSRDELYERR